VCLQLARLSPVDIWGFTKVSTYLKVDKSPSKIIYPEDGNKIFCRNVGKTPHTQSGIIPKAEATCYLQQ
jgi:hypothetical protein